MQNTIGKLLEKVIAGKISDILELQGNLLPTLGGYRPGRKTWANAAVFEHDVYEGFHEGIQIFAAAIDLEDAYNRVPLDLIMCQVIELDISPILNWITAALFSAEDSV